MRHHRCLGPFSFFLFDKFVGGKYKEIRHTRRKVGDEECATYVVPDDDTTDDFLSSFQIVLDWFKTLDHAACPIFWC